MRSSARGTAGIARCRREPAHCVEHAMARSRWTAGVEHMLVCTRPRRACDVTVALDRRRGTCASLYAPASEWVTSRSAPGHACVKNGAVVPGCSAQLRDPKTKERELVPKMGARAAHYWATAKLGAKLGGREEWGKADRAWSAPDRAYMEATLLIEVHGGYMAVIWRFHGGHAAHRGARHASASEWGCALDRQRLPARAMGVGARAARRSLARRSALARVRENERARRCERVLPRGAITRSPNTRARIRRGRRAPKREPLLWPPPRPRHRRPVLPDAIPPRSWRAPHRHRRRPASADFWARALRARRARLAVPCVPRRRPHRRSRPHRHDTIASSSPAPGGCRGRARGRAFSGGRRRRRRRRRRGGRRPRRDDAHGELQELGARRGRALIAAPSGGAAAAGTGGGSGGTCASPARATAVEKQRLARRNTTRTNASRPLSCVFAPLLCSRVREGAPVHNATGRKGGPGCASATAQPAPGRGPLLGVSP